ncbi:MAG: MFS transporter [Methanomassiliicoccus sp.]|nr:MFS transporter [Methanomassiliicoccus sp.]
MGLANLSFYVFQGYFIFYLQDSGLNYLQMSVIYAVNLIFSAVLSLPMGNVADRYGRKRAFAIGAAIMAVSMLIYAFNHAFAVFLVAEVIWAVGWALLNGSNEAWVVDQLSKDDRSSEGPRAFTVMMSMSYVLGVAGGVLASMLVIFSLNMPFLGAAIIAFTCAALVWRRLPENYGAEKVRLGKILGDSLKFYRSNKGLQLLTAGETFRYIASVIYLFLYQPYLVAIGLGEEFLGVYFSVLMLSSAAGSLIAPRVADRMGGHRVMALSSLGLFAGFALLALSPGLAASCFLFALCGFSNGLGWPPLMIWRNRLVPSRIRASALAMFASFTYIAGAAITIALGALMDASSSSAGFAFAAFIGLLSIPLYLQAAKKKERGEAAAVTAPVVRDGPQQM